MFQVTYQLKNTQMRNTIDLTEYWNDIECIIMSFPMLELLDVTQKDFTISVNARTTQAKNGVVRAFGSKLAANSGLGKMVCRYTNSAEVIIAKNCSASG